MNSFVIIILLEFKVGGTYICTTAHYTHKIFYSNTIFIGSLGDLMMLKKTAK